MSIFPPPTHDTFLAQSLRIATPSSGYCLRCGWPWRLVKIHDTKYNINSGCFPLCERCWTDLGNPEARIEYYKALIDAWDADGPPVDEDRKREIQRAVANGG